MIVVGLQGQGALSAIHGPGVEHQFSHGGIVPHLHSLAGAMTGEYEAGNPALTVAVPTVLTRQSRNSAIDPSTSDARSRFSHHDYVPDAIGQGRIHRPKQACGNRRGTWIDPGTLPQNVMPALTYALVCLINDIHMTHSWLARQYANPPAQRRFVLHPDAMSGIHHAVIGRYYKSASFGEHRTQAVHQRVHLP